ncbi:hypothetical protein SEA_ARGIE_29 [Mycobacterium phage Argie]|nr:hypothetical protein SEA_ARGIE_29 [Mycobacterium phage Argie]
MPVIDFVEPNVCVGENLVTDQSGLLMLQPWAFPRLVRDVRAVSNDGNGSLPATKKLPGKLMVNQQVEWLNDGPLPQDMLVRVIRGPRQIITSNPNAIQFRDRWSYAMDAQPALPQVTGYFNSQTGVAVDLGTNSVAEPVPGKQRTWWPVNCQDEWIPYQIEPGSTFRLWYRCYVWTPPPWADNANKGNPEHRAWANWVRLQLWAHPRQGTIVTG